MVTEICTSVTADIRMINNHDSLIINSDGHQCRNRDIRSHIDSIGSTLETIYTLLIQKGQVSYFLLSLPLISRKFLLAHQRVLQVHPPSQLLYEEALNDHNPFD
ncbi:hypothetical protein QL285_093107 [Trifolium repens]|jgi:hypothetical protein|nr:hypothetical protein QL285_093107 [Trifolium repens]